MCLMSSMSYRGNPDFRSDLVSNMTNSLARAPSND